MPLVNADEEYVKSDIVQPFLPTRSAIVMTKDGQYIGIIGEYSQVVLRSLKVPTQSAGFEIDIEVLLSANKRAGYIALPKYPRVEQDISLRLASTISYDDIYAILQQALASKKPKNTFAQLTPLDIYQANDSADVKHISFRLSIASYDETLKAPAVNSLLDDIATDAAQKCGAERL